jgi:hypothetical protein
MTHTTAPSAPADDFRARNKATLFAALAEAGIHRVTVEYDGSGDSGQIENVEAWDARNERMTFPSGVMVQLASETPTQLLPERLEAAVETLAWDYLEISIGWGWENNDGAFGTFVFDVPARTIALEHNERYTEITTTSHEF